MPNGLISLDTNDDLKSLNKAFKDNDYYMDINSYELTRMEYYLELARLGTIDLTGEVEFNYVPLYRRNRSDIDTHSFYDLHNRQFSDYIPSGNVNLDEIRKLVLTKEKLERLIRSRELLAVEDESIWEIESMLHKAGPRLSKNL